MSKIKEIAQWVIDNRCAKSKNEKISDSEMYNVLIEKINAVFANNRIESSYPLDKNHICFSSGHNMYLVYKYDNGRSYFGENKCSRCGYLEPFQWDK